MSFITLVRGTLASGINERIDARGGSDAQLLYPVNIEARKNWMRLRLFVENIFVQMLSCIERPI